MYFITYGNKLLGCYTQIDVSNYARARSIAYKGTDGGKYSAMYDIRDLGRRLQLGYLHTEVPLQSMEIFDD